MLYARGIIQFQQDHSSIRDCHVVKERILLQADIELTGHHKHLIWTSSRICGVRWIWQCMKPCLFSIPELVMRYELLCQMLGMKLLCHSITFDQWLSPWHNEWNQWLKHRGSALLKEISIWKQPFKGSSLNILTSTKIWVRTDFIILITWRSTV